MHKNKIIHLNKYTNKLELYIVESKKELTTLTKAIDEKYIGLDLELFLQPKPTKEYPSYSKKEKLENNPELEWNLQDFKNNERRLERSYSNEYESVRFQTTKQTNQF